MGSKRIEQRHLKTFDDGSMPEFLVFLPDGAEILSVHVLKEDVFMHVLVDMIPQGAHRKFIGFSVCEEFPDVPMTFIGKVAVNKGTKILHIFELLSNPRPPLALEGEP